jgi:hypothetical protein
MEGQSDEDGNKRRRDSQGNLLPAGGGATIMTGTGQSLKNVQDITTAIKVYDGGVVSGDLTLSDDRDWAGTMRHCEDTVSTPDLGEDRDVLISCLQVDRGEAPSYRQRRST